MEDILILASDKMERSIEAMENKFVNVRAGRANPAILDPIVVNYYGVDTPLKQLATISIPEARCLQIKPFDKSCLGAIEKAIYEADLGINPNNNGETIILNIPALTEDKRKEYVKQVRTIAEEIKISIRNIRQETKKDIEKLEESEDIKDKLEQNLQDLVNQYNKKVDELLEVKEKELLTV